MCFIRTMSRRSMKTSVAKHLLQQ
ncbi:hypothetical protein ZEAMMB73_Zm00001d006012 [Zea mays]|uniref:Uncharacterized protein n=1 Tax=Zea mays TaxID=4577 RepID=A0A1D6ES27_MAIZE|nr:hypothetical protein ZEAMMB73_Zm00001d006012 [Zea mays]